MLKLGTTCVCGRMGWGVAGMHALSVQPEHMTASVLRAWTQLLHAVAQVSLLPSYKPYHLLPICLHNEAHSRCAAAQHCLLQPLLSRLSGGSHEGYVKWACVAAASRGWRAVVLNMRGCNGLPLTSARGYNAINTADLHVAVQSIHRCGRAHAQNDACVMVV
jgi:hypothetical protein